MSKEVLVVIGVGGMGQAIVRRSGSGKTVLLADVDEASLQGTADLLSENGHQVITHPVDVSSHESVVRLAHRADALGPVAQVVHTAGLSPVQASAKAILRVDLLGVAFSLEEFGRVIAPGGAGVVIASMAAHLAAVLTSEQEIEVVRTPCDDLLRLSFLDPASVTDPGLAYGVAKRANQLLVQAASATWGQRQARINSISPGIVSTPMGRQELRSTHGQAMRAMIEASAVGREGTPDDIASATAFLLGNDASFVTGTDLLVDGGVVACLRSGRLAVPVDPDLG